MRGLHVWAALVAVIALASALGATAQVASPRPQCRKPGFRCSLYNDLCCNKRDYFCTMGTKCTSITGPEGCLPTCEKKMTVRLEPKLIDEGLNLTIWEAGNPRHPAVIVLQEWWGVNDAIKETAYFIGQQGYRVAIPDLYRGEYVNGTNGTDAAALAGKLNWTLAVMDMVRTAEYLKETGSPKVAVTGFCQGGGLALCAAQYADVVGAAPFYGAPSPALAPMCNVSEIKVPVLYQWGLNREGGATNFLNAASQMAVAGVDVTVHVHPRSPHAFMNFLTPLAREFTIAGGRPIPPEREIRAAFAYLTDFLAHRLK